MQYLLLLLINCIFITPTLAVESAPTFQDNILTLPRVDTQVTPGQYQNVKFKLAADGRWDIVQYREASLAYIDTIEVQTLKTFPVQIQLLVSGNFPSPCYRLSDIFTRRDEHKFIVSVTQEPLQTLVACAQVLQPFQTTIKLDVYGLEKGSYQVLVNDKSASFELTVDNSLN